MGGVHRLNEEIARKNDTSTSIFNFNFRRPFGSIVQSSKQRSSCLVSCSAKLLSARCTKLLVRRSRYRTARNGRDFLAPG